MTKTHAEFLKYLKVHLENEIIYWSEIPSTNEWFRSKKSAYKYVIKKIEQFEAEQKVIHEQKAEKI